MCAGLLHAPTWSLLALQSVPHWPPAPQKASEVQGCPMSVPPVQTSFASRQAFAPLPAGGGGSCNEQVASSMLLHSEPGHWASKVQNFRKLPVPLQAPPPAHSVALKQ